MSDEKIKETVMRAYDSLWSGGSCCQPEEDAPPSSCESCGSPMELTASPRDAHGHLMEVLDPKPGMRVLDVGSGSGEAVLQIAEKVAPDGLAAGVDFSPRAIALARERAKQAGLESVTEFRRGEAESLPFDDGAFDAVLSECVVCLVPDKTKALREKVRVLKPGGRVIMHDVVARLEMPGAIRKNSALYCDCIGGAVSVDDYRAMMAEAGLVDVEVHDHSEEAMASSNLSILSAAMGMEDEEDYRETVDFVRRGGIGYALFVGRKPGEEAGPSTCCD